VCDSDGDWTARRALNGRKSAVSTLMLVAGDAVVRSCAVGGHCPVDDVDQVALEDAACAMRAFGWLAAGWKHQCC
jgi:hypothetical protein